MKKVLTHQESNDAISALISTSQLFVIVEYRGHKIETIEYLDKRTGQKASFSRLVMAVESQAPSADQISVAFNVPDGYKAQGERGAQTLVPEGNNPPFDIGITKGMKMLATVEGAETKMGMKIFRGIGYAAVLPPETPATKK